MRSRKRAGIALFLLLILLIITAKARAVTFTYNLGPFDRVHPPTLLTGETGTINLGGRLIIAASRYRFGIRSRSSSRVSIFNHGTIEMRNTSQAGIVYEITTDSSILNSGSIKTTEDSSVGIKLEESDGEQTITNSGTIETLGEDSYGIFSHLSRVGATTTITNSGELTTSGVNAYGIISSYNRGITNIYNTNNLKTSGEHSHGIFLYRNSGTEAATNSGTISTSGMTTGGEGSYGIYSRLNSGTVTITNRGTITTSGPKGHGMGASENSGTSNIYNISNILTSGDTSHGIIVHDNSAINSITNSGTITTSGLGSPGIYSIYNTGTNSIANSGTITTHGPFSHGITSTRNSGTENISNDGTITTSGENSYGMALNQNTGTINATNSGTIQVTGPGSVGVGMHRGVTLTNSGTISATGNAKRAIDSMGAYNDTLNLLPGSKILGTIHLGDGADTVNITSTQAINQCATAACTSASLYIGGSNVDINVSDPTAIYVIGPNSVATVDPTGHSVLGVSLSEMTSAVHDVVSQRMARTRQDKRGSETWVEAFGAYRKRGAEGAAFAHDHRYMGYTGGIEKNFKRGSVGLMTGYANSRVATKQASNSTNTNTFFGGLYSDVYLGRVNLTSSLLGGYEFHDNTRIVQVHNLGKTEAAKADFSSVFFTPSVTLSAAQPLGSRFELRPSTSVIYTLSRYTNYQEKGTTGANLFIDDRTVQVLKAKVQLALALKLNKNSEFELRTGFTTRHTDHDDIKASMGKSTTSFAAAGKNTIQGGFIGGNLHLNVTENLHAIADVKFRGAGGHESEIVARAGIGYRF